MTCTVHEYNQLKEKQGRGEKLTDDEREIVEADTKEELEEAVPDNYGPASDFNGDYCKFCYGVGLFTVLLTAFSIVSLFIVGGSLAQYFLSGTLIGTVTQVASGIGVLPAVIVSAVFLKKVRLKGYYPVLGPAFGPYIESFFSMFGIHLTATARRGEDDLRTLEESEEDEFSVETTESTDDTEPMTDEKFTNRLSEERSEKLELKSKLDQEQTQKKHWKSKAEKKDERIEDLEATVEGYENAAGVVSGSGDVDPDTVWELNIAHYENRDKAGNESFYAKFFTKYQHDSLGDIWLPVGGYEKQTIKKMEPSEPREMDLEDIKERTAYFPWENPDEAIDQKIDFLDTSNRKFHPNEDVSLIHDHLGAAEETRKGIFSPDTDYVKVSIDCGLDTNGNPVPLRGNNNGFERREELRNKVEDLQKKLRRRTNQVQERQRQVEDLQHDNEELQIEIQNLKNRLERARQNERQAIEGQAATEHTQHVQNEQKEILGKELHREEQKRAVLEDRVDEAEKAAVSGNGSSTHVTEEEAKSEKEQERIEKVEKIREFWVSDEIDHTRLSEDDYEYDHVDFIREFRNTDDDELPKAAKNLKRKLDNPDQVKNGGPA